jgi:cold shock CspA family protein
MPSLDSLSGVVSSFDDPRGLGMITGSDGVPRRFHCTQIADGSRTIAAGTEVTFTEIAAPDGTWEAGSVEPT